MSEPFYDEDFPELLPCACGSSDEIEWGYGDHDHLSFRFICYECGHLGPVRASIPAARIAWNESMGHEARLTRRELDEAHLESEAERDRDEAAGISYVESPVHREAA